MSDIAAFDVDGTLTVRDCVLPFMRRVGGIGTLVAATSSSATAIAARRRDDVKARFCRQVFSGREVAEIDQIAHSFATTVARSWLRRDTLARLRWHQQMGHDVVLVSASLRPYLSHLATYLEVDHVLCTDLAQVDGVYTGEMVGSNCRGAEKVARLQSWATSRGLPDDLSWLTHAYGDSAGDRAMLARAARAHDVSRGDIEPTC
jgi:phosphatidylglycerophosphatase C